MTARHGMLGIGEGREFDLCVPDNYRGPFVFPATGRRVWWTGRVAIGLRHGLDTSGASPSLATSPSARGGWTSGATA